MPDSPFSPVWPGPALLVPITLDALLVGQGNQVPDYLWAQTGVNYGALSQLGAAVVPFSRKANDSLPGTGAHLLWTLPYSLRSGSQQTSGPDAGDVVFPFIPNRWAVLRWFVSENSSDPSQPSSKPPALSAGILRSDDLHTLAKGDTPYPGGDKVQGIGVYKSLDMWDGQVSGPAFLKAAGPGDVAWSAAYDNVANVFAFYDPLGDANGFYSYQVIGWYADPTTDALSGWSTADDWQALMTQLGWGVGQDQDHALPANSIAQAQSDWAAWQTAHGLSGTTFDATKIDQAAVPGPFATLMTKWGGYYAANGTAELLATQLTLPAQTLCHGSVLGLHWKGPLTSYPSGAPSGGVTGPAVAVGNTPSEAVAAWMANWIHQTTQQPDTDEIEVALNAFQKGLVFDLGKQPVETAANLQAAQFTSHDGGSQWTVIRPEQPAGQSGGINGSGNSTIPLSAPQIAALRALNSAQAASDSADRTLQAVQWELWALYYKNWYIDVSFSSEYQDQVTAALTKLIGVDALNRGGPIAGLLGQAQQQAVAGATAVESSLQSLEQLLTADDTTRGFVVKKVNRISFSNPVDPVILVAGLKADTKHAPPDAFGGNGFVFTRFTGQTLTSLTISLSSVPTNPVTLGIADLTVPFLSLPGASGTNPLGIPKEVADLWCEALLIDSSNRAWLASLYADKYKKTYQAQSPLSIDTVAQLILAQQTALWNDAATLGVPISAISATANFTGIPPSPIALEDGSTQPWSPLYIDWKVEWCPSPIEADGITPEWQLSGLDYQWQNSQMPSSPIIYQGRTTVDPMASQKIAQQLESFVGTDPDFDQLPDWIQQDLTQVKVNIQQFDFVTQSLSGLTNQLLTQLPAASLNVPSSYFSGANQDIKALVHNAEGVQPVVLDANGNPPLYYPFRAGHFRVLDLWVVDAFGQVMTTKRQVDPCVHLITASTLTTPGANFVDYVQVPPRFSQPARLNFTMIDATDDSEASTSADATSPICGWVIANHLDDSLMVYDAAGINLGSVIVIEKDEEQTGLRWDAAPGSSQPLGASPAIENTHLSGFITALLLAGASGSDALRELLDVIDAAAWAPTTFGAPPPGGQGNVALLAGRPFAVVRTRLDLELFGDPMLSFNQDITQSGNDYPPALPPKFTTTAFSVQVGNEHFATNSAVGFFVGDDYSTFNSVTANPKSTSTMRRTLASGGRVDDALESLGEVNRIEAGSYVVPGQPLSLAAKQISGQTASTAQTYLTVLMDPAGRIPVLSGAFPVLYGDLPPGPVATALAQMNISFRAGPLLLDADAIKMPLPSEIHGNWSWMERENVTLWATPQQPQQSNAVPGASNTPLRLREGWLVLSNSQSAS